MLPKEKKESTELQVINLDNLNPALLPELATFKEIQLKVVEDNPFIAITDSASRDLAKKHRTARVSARTALQAQDKLISSKFNAAKDKAKGYIAELIAYTQPGEIEQQKEIDRDEAVLEEKRQEKARLERERIETIKQKIDDYVASWKDAFNLMVFEKIEEVSANFYESYTTYDLTVLEEFEALFPSKIEELTQYLQVKTTSLTDAENARLEKLRLEQEAKLLAQQKSELEAKQKLADEAEAKAKKERENFEKEKADFERKQAEAQAKLDAELKQKEQEEADSLVELNATQITETPQPEKVEVAEVLAPEEPTVNTYFDLPKEITWKTIQERFKDSGEKSYSLWLENNYNVPTEL